MTRSSWIAAGVLTLFGLAFYLPHLHAPFIFDDQTLISGNVYIRSLKFFKNYFFAPRVESSGLFDGSWRPLSVLSLALNYQMSGLQVWSYRLTNLFLHIFNSILLYSVLNRSIPNRRVAFVNAAFFAALLFLLHPLQTQTILHTWKRTGMLSTAFILIALWAAQRLKGTALILAVVGAQILALMSKEDGVLLPLVLGAFYLSWPTYSKEKSSRFALILAAMISSAYLFVYLFWIRHQIADTRQMAELGPNRINPIVQEQLIALWRSLTLFVWPSGLTIDHRIVVTPMETAGAAIGILSLVSLWIWAFVKRGRHWIFVGAVLLVPFVPFFIARTNVSMDESRAYLPAFAFGLLVVLLVQGRMPAILAFVALALFSFRTERRAHIFHDPVRLWTEAVEVDGGNVRAHCALSFALIGAGQPRLAMNHAEAAMRLAPNYSDSRLAIARAEDALGSPNTPESYRKVLEVNPKRFDAWNNLGAWEAEHGRLESAIFAFRKSLEINPNFLEAQRNLLKAERLFERSGSVRSSSPQSK